MAHRKIVPRAIFVFTHPAAIELVVYNLHSKANLFKMNRFLFQKDIYKVSLQFYKVPQSSKIVNWMRGQRSNKTLILVIIKLLSIKFLFDLWPLIQCTIFDEKPCKCPSEEESIHFEETCFTVYSFRHLIMLISKGHLCMK